MLKSVSNANIHIPDHTIIEKIGSGGMSSVYLGRQISLQRKVAIKVLRTLVMDNQEMAERFVHEATTIASLDHPHIISIYEAKKLPSGLTYFTMPYLNHGNFGDIICTNADHLIDLLSQICEGLAFAHDRGVIHRDLKPDNILFDQFGQIKIADFGIALSRDTERRTKDEQILGSAHFMSPEQIQSRDINYLSDIYSLGCIIYEKLTGDHIYEANNDFAVLLAHINKPAPELPKALAKWQPIMNKCLAKKVEDRYQSALEVKADLMEIRSHNGKSQLKKKRQPLSLPAWLNPWQVGAVCGVMTLMILAILLWPSNHTKPEQLSVTANSAPSALDNNDNLTGNAASAITANITPVHNDTENNVTAVDTTPKKIIASELILSTAAEVDNQSQLISLNSPPLITEVTTDETNSLAGLPDESLIEDLMSEELMSEDLMSDESSGAESSESSGSENTELNSTDPLSIDISSMIVLDENGQAIDPPENYVDLLLDQGQALLKKYRLTKPAGDSAIDRFKAVLAIEPENMSAKEGINQIARNYYKLVVSKRKAGELAKAQTFAKAMTSFIRAEGVDENIFKQSYDKLYAEAASSMRTAIENRRQAKTTQEMFSLATTFINNESSAQLQEQYNQIPQLGKLLAAEQGHQMVFITGQASDQDFMVMQNEVTAAQFEQFAGDNVSKDKCEHLGGKGIFKRYSWKKPPFDQTAQHPVICIAATEAQAYATWLSTKTGHTYRLPTTAEWQQLNTAAGNENNCASANLAGQETSSKSKISSSPLNCNDKAMYTSTVGKYTAKNSINDINGNVAEWTLDCTNSAGCQSFALAGNSWQSGQGAKNSAITKATKETRVSHAGFRLVRTFD